MKFYKLDDEHNPVAITDSLEWAKWFETSKRHVDNTEIGDVRVSTVFLGLDHSLENFDGSMKDYVPILFETMIFGGERDQYQERYATWDEAKAGHEFAVSLIK
jgi:hypothetical protein